MLFGSAAAVVHTMLRVPVSAFFGRNAGMKPLEAPDNMLLAMFLAAALCVLIGVYYPLLYAVLPFQEAADYAPYKLDGIMKSLQLTAGAALGFALLARFGLKPRRRAITVLDVDWLYRRLGYTIAVWAYAMTVRLSNAFMRLFSRVSHGIDLRMHALFAPSGALNRAVPSVALAGWTALILAVALVLAFLGG
jgi:multicomponent Na+:H+ antiporter subunit D